ncbi:hypothetical protein A1O1_08201 [Capronia coronata CBS 617.96]|uniref:PAC domain-containing protein n=1 Tax=Capronia coronata CBS 617.96 TaxID=1182541 RepID=W9XNK2_9EURO|nr:uncharacterized protein A1O1_08201 [Capronia coronata CBS 617.96]EXJ82132.1 hypothetical protein A1O1_08201 [Capronia coronata CBS 617.96]
MDLERLKQNLRLRSGRLKKTRKATGKPTPAAVQSKVPDARSNSTNFARPSSQPPTAAVYSPIGEEPSLRNWDTNATLPIAGPASPPDHRPDQPRAATRSYPSSDPRESSPARYGRSGIERPQTGDLPEPTKGPPPVHRAMSETDMGAVLNSDASDAVDFDLRPPPPRPKPPSLESLAESLFSPEHLNVLLRHPDYLARFTSFLAKYQPHIQPVLLRFLATQKAIKAVEYANAVAEGLELVPAADDGPSVAAKLDKAFAESNVSAFRLLADTALPAYITYNLVKVASDCLIDEITGRQTPGLGDLVGGLSEIFCLTDPKQEDNPIIYASSEFYRFTGYGPDDVIGRNCRFLQGTKTKRESVSRLRSSIENGHEISETLLNYRRDGRPFINLLMIAPLHDDKGNVKYHIGAQVDVTGLAERGRGLDGFERYLVTKEIEKREKELRGNVVDADPARARKSKALTKLRELSETFDLEESAVVRSHSRSASSTREDDEYSTGSSRRAPRRLIADPDSSSHEDEEDQGSQEDGTWKLGEFGQFGSSGKLPGVYDSYMLIRPAPSLRIVFVSPKLRRRLGDIIQHPFLSHVAAPSRTLAGLKESFGTGVPVSAKIHFMRNRGERRDGTKISADKKPDEAGQSRVCWISATPLLGSDDNIGVWMVVIVDKMKVLTTRRRENGLETNENQNSVSANTGLPTKIDVPPYESLGQQQSPREDKTSDQDGRPGDTPIKPTRLDQSADYRNTVRSPSPPRKNGFVDKDGPRQTDYDESQQVLDLQSGLASQANAEQESDFVPVNTNHSDHGFDSPAVSNDGSDGQMEQAYESNEPQPGHTGADSDGEPDAPTTLEVDSAIDNSLAAVKASVARLALETPYSHDMHDEADPFHGFSDNEDTPRRPQHLTRFDSRSDSPSRPGTSAMESSSTRSNGKHYMDYLLHPGSRASSEYNRPLSGSGLMSSMYHPDDIDYGDEGDDSNEAQCVRTPYSVD